MYFISRDMFKYRSLVFVSPWILYSASLLFLIVLSSAWWFLLYCPLVGWQEQYAQQVVQLGAAVDQSHVKQGQQGSCDEACVMSKKQLSHEHIATVPYDQRMMTIFNLLSTSHIFLAGYNPAQEIDKQWYSKRIVNYSLQGTFEHLMLFFQNLAHAGLMVQSDYVTITALSDGVLHVDLMLDFIQTKSECCA